MPWIMCARWPPSAETSSSPAADRKLTASPPAIHGAAGAVPPGRDRRRAALDRLWTEALFAADAPVLNACDFAVLPPSRLPFARVRLHPVVLGGLRPGAARPVAGQPRRRGGAGDRRRARGLLITRPKSGPEPRLLSPAAAAFLTGCAAGKALHRAMADTLGQHPDADMSRIFAGLIAAGAFTALR
ncbi:hypothetical protein P7B02_05215 [Caulobacter segnis]|uniref:hypothetical protein n=1 Tax=Caulobacter segnis TaxID=88688 RepID=UPI0024104BF5|nr:hypothetical protein [Caulobacter segnis]MDG2520937.1 hypothetical protein [Caulobacter segnis]